jgi:hypothetical protein
MIVEGQRIDPAPTKQQIDGDELKRARDRRRQR